MVGSYASLPVRLSVTGPKVTRPKIISQQPSKVMWVKVKLMLGFRGRDINLSLKWNLPWQVGSCQGQVAYFNIAHYKKDIPKTTQFLPFPYDPDENIKTILNTYRVTNKCTSFYVCIWSRWQLWQFYICALKSTIRRVNCALVKHPQNNRVARRENNPKTKIGKNII